MSRSFRKKPEIVIGSSIDYKDQELLKNFVMDNGRIVPSRVTNATTYQQRQISKAVKIARFLALLPYSDSH